MRLCLLLSLTLCCALGCGKKTGDSAAVDLAIENPRKAANDSAAAAEKKHKDEARQYLVQAADFARRGLVGKSVETLSHAISASPENPELYIARAEVYGMMREDANALADYSTAIRMAPKDASIHNRRGFFLLSRNEHTRALQDFSAAIELNAKSPQACNNRGLVYLAIGQNEKAIADFEAALKLDEAYADAWNNIGFARYRLKQYKQAASDLTQAIRHRENYVNALNNRGLVYLATENFKAAVDDFSRAIEIDPYEIKLFQGRRTAQLRLENFPAAQSDASRIQWLVGLADLTRQIDQEPLVATHYLKRGRYLATDGEHRAALRDYSQAAQLDSENPEPLLRRAASLLAMGQLDEAIRDCDTVIEVGGPREAFSVRGDAWLAKGDHDQAIADYERAGRADLTVADAYLLRAAALETAGEKSRADADRARAAAIDPSRVTQ